MLDKLHPRRPRIAAYQVVYSEEVRSWALPGFKVVENPDNQTPFFENEPIANLIESGALDYCDYFGVFSPKLISKHSWSVGLDRSMEPTYGCGWSRVEMFRYMISANLTESMSTCAGTDEFLSRLQSKFHECPDADVYSLASWRNHDVAEFGSYFHPGFRGALEALLEHIGQPTTDFFVENPVYFNHWLARPVVWRDYYDNWLRPAMEALSGELAWIGELDSKYGDPPKALTKLGYTHFTMHTFLCERLPSLFFKSRPSLRFCLF